jgi:integrase
MGLFRRKEGKIYYFAIMRDGNRIVKSTGASNKKLAQEIYEQALTEIIRGKWFINERARKTTFRETVEKYTMKYQRQRDPITIKQLLPYFGDMTLSEITTEVVEDYIIQRMKAPKSPSHVTIYLEYGLCRRIFNVAMKTWHWVSLNPFADFDYKQLLERDNPRKRVISVEEELQLLSNAYNHDISDFIIAGIHTGCRRGEILSWDWKETVDMEKRFLMVKVSKRTRKKVVYKTIPMSETLYKMLLRRYKVMHISGKVFPMDMHQVRYAFVQSAKAAGVKNVRVHDLRKTFSTRLDESGVPLHIIKALLGHSTNDVTELHYIHRAVESLRPYILLLDKYYKEKLEEVMRLVG